MKVGITSNQTALEFHVEYYYNPKGKRKLNCLGKVGGINMVCHILAIVVCSLYKSSTLCLEEQVDSYKELKVVTIVNYGWKHCGKE
jgi:hypothetical protein